MNSKYLQYGFPDPHCSGMVIFQCHHDGNIVDARDKSVSRLCFAKAWSMSEAGCNSSIVVWDGAINAHLEFMESKEMAHLA
jgi:hypothetical protein